MFIDRARIRVTGGAGGNGCVSVRREKYVPQGGPNGGDGGNGGSVYLVADGQLSTLLDLRYHGHWKGERGVHGKGYDRHGKNGGDLFVRVPCGTVVRDLDTDEILCDLTEEGAQFCVALGGKGGKGNARFISSIDKAPRFAEKGEPGEEREYRLELKVMADVGLVGLPNAGKSTFLAQVSAAQPKIADYPFTTLSPNLGVVRLGDYRSLVIADIPGIIEGAAEGKGLGHDFLRHIERTKVLLFLVDLGDEDPAETSALLEEELVRHSDVFRERPRHHALNKVDVTENRERVESLLAALPNARAISAATGEGIPPLLETLWADVERLRREALEEVVPEPERTYGYEAPFEIHAVTDGFRVEGKRVLRVVRMTDFSNSDGVRHLQHTLDKMGLFLALKRMGAEPGQSIWIGDVELEYRPE